MTFNMCHVIIYNIYICHMSYVIDQKSYVMSMSLCVTCVTCDDMSYVICHMSICQYVKTKLPMHMENA